MIAEQIVDQFSDQISEAKDSIESSVGDLGHRLMGVLNLVDAAQIKDTIEDLRSEVMTKLDENPFRTTIEVAGVGFMVGQLFTSGQSNVWKWLARGVGTYAASKLMEKISGADIEPYETRH